MSLSSLGIFVGSSKCNANCAHCAGVPHRQFAQKHDGIVNTKLIKDTLIKCSQMGATSLSLSSSGEPTLSPESVSIVLEIVCELSHQYHFNNIHLYSNGILIGKNEEFCDEYLGYWRSLGLDTIYLTVHSTDKVKNAEIYGIKKYPPLTRVINRIHKVDLKVRANVVLGKETVSSADEFILLVKELLKLKFDSISSWGVRDKDDQYDIVNALSEEEYDKIETYIFNNGIKNVKLYRESKHRESYIDNNKLTLFPDGILSNTWCKH
jgi:molybdenum cofactor biosynthesis enzyme MoaA